MNTTPIDLLVLSVLAGMAAFRVTRVVTADFIFEDVRFKIWDILLNKDGTVDGWRQKLGYLIGCDWCLGFWVTLAIVLPIGFISSFQWLDFILLWFASAGFQGIFANLTKD